MEDRCFGRIISWSNSSIARFSKCAKSRFYLESRCQNKSIHDQLCQSCLEKKDQKASEPRKNLYGLVTDPLPADCRIFGSEWYESKVKELGQPSESDMARAKKAQEEARKDTVVVAQPVVVKTEAKKRGRKPKQEPAPVLLPLLPNPIQTQIPVLHRLLTQILTLLLNLQNVVQKRISHKKPKKSKCRRLKPVLP